MLKVNRPKVLPGPSELTFGELQVGELFRIQPDIDRWKERPVFMKTENTTTTERNAVWVFPDTGRMCHFDNTCKIMRVNGTLDLDA